MQFSSFLLPENSKSSTIEMPRMLCAPCLCLKKDCQIETSCLCEQTLVMSCELLFATTFPTPESSSAWSNVVAASSHQRAQLAKASLFLLSRLARKESQRGSAGHDRSLLNRVDALCSLRICFECGFACGDSLFFASPKKSKQKKGDPIRWCYALPCDARLKGALRAKWQEPFR